MKKILITAAVAALAIAATSNGVSAADKGHKDKLIVRVIGTVLKA